MRPIDLANASNADYIEQLFLQYRKDPSSVPEAWQSFFAGFELASGRSEMVLSSSGLQSPIGVFDLVHSYRELGHLGVCLDPLGLVKREPHPHLGLEHFNITEADLDRLVGSGGFEGPTDGTLRDLLDKLQKTYATHIAVEYTGISDAAQREWLQKRMEANYNRPKLSKQQKHAIMFQLVAAEEFEQYLHRVFVGAKRFSLEGGEALVPLLNTIVDHGAAHGGEQYIMCMAHRGRLNTLAHVLNKPYENILGEFAGTNIRPEDDKSDGDVKYHLGYANTRLEPGGQKVKISMLPNPSHLELINPIQQGIIRCKQEWLGDTRRSRVIPVTLHGDAAFCGQGIVFETLNLSELAGFRTGGTLHIIVNNQIGFTTSPQQGRFTPYPTDVAKAIQAPIFHVNGDDVEAVVHVAQIAIEFRQKFLCDAMIDLWCYRRHGHNEADEPSYTQPVMYRAIKDKKTTRQVYAEQLLAEGSITQTELDEMKKVALERLGKAREAAKNPKVRDKIPTFSGVWSGYGKANADWTAKTAVDKAVLEKVISVYDRVPEGFTVHPKLVKLLEDRKDAVRKDAGIDWGTGEMLAFGSLVDEGFRIRVTGQDVERGTFSHRQAGLYDYNTGSAWYPLKNVDRKQGEFTVRNSMLSEEAVLAFEWGYASSDPRNLVIWEAQFGDFVNGAQAVIDQIISSAEDKWRYANGLVMLLPHGYEGAGPEHSNAYLERFLSLCAEDNMQVVVPSTPASYFHMLRRQMHRKFRKPMIAMMPKALLRKKETFSQIADFTKSDGALVLDDPRMTDAGKAEQVKRVLCCSGKVFYTLDAARQMHGITDTAVIRVEQLYPFPRKELEAVIARYRRRQEVSWLQEEPANRGAWRFIEPLLREMYPDNLIAYYGRGPSASPASGSYKESDREETEFINAALAVDKRKPAKTEAVTAK
jgi:2-oxoglutarate dehydrogenase E1 component